MGVERIL